MVRNLINGLLRITDKRRSERTNFSLGLSLAFIAGAINAGGFMVVHQYTSHMTGLMSMVADSVALNKLGGAAIILFYILCFICGAMTTAILAAIAAFAICTAIVDRGGVAFKFRANQ